MNGPRWAALACALAGGALLAYAAANGDVKVGLLLIIPFVYGMGLAPTLGMLLLLTAAGLWFVGAARDAGVVMPARPGEPDARATKTGGVVLLGPIPIVWGSDRRVLVWMIVAGAALLVLALLLNWARR